MQEHVKIWLKSRGYDWTEAHYNCENCFWNNWVDVHHIVSRRFKNTNVPWNLIMLCRSCHVHAHANNNTEWKAELFQMIKDY